LALIQRPELLQAVASVATGKLGQRRISVGKTVASPAAVLNALSLLTHGATQEAENDAVEGTDAYLRDAQGEFVCDIASPTARAETLLAHLRASEATEEYEETPEDWLLESGLAELAASGG